MGKALLVLVLGAGMILARHTLSAQETENHTTRNQQEFEEETLAREIARSAFNTAMGQLREHGEQLQDGVNVVNGGTRGRNAGTSGSAQGGQFRVKAELLTGHSVRVTSTGYFGGYFNSAGQYVRRGANGREEPAPQYTMHDTYRLPVLIARERLNELVVTPGTSGGGYCSAIFLEEWQRGEPAPTRRMIFPPDNNQQRAFRPALNLVVEGGTQMNFIMAVDENCSTRPTIAVTDTCGWRRYTRSYTFNAGDWDSFRPALDIRPDAVDRPAENVWAMVEQQRGQRQTWRIGWEDLRQNWDRPVNEHDSRTLDPRGSLQATKRVGYDGNGWAFDATTGYRVVRDFGNQPDFEDQIIHVSLRPIRRTTDALENQAAEAIRYREAQANVSCGVPGATLPPTPTSPTPTSPTPTSPTPTSPTPTSCPCPSGNNDKKVYILHRPPGAESNEQRICVAERGWIDGHQGRHNDEVICRGE